MERQKEELRRIKRKKQAIAGAVAAVLTIVALVTGSCAVERKRTQRVSVLWSEALKAKEAGNWQGVIAATQGVLAIRPGSPLVLALKREAETAARLAKERAEAAERLAKEKAEAAERLAKEKVDAARPAGDTYDVALDGGVKLEMVWCPAGSFMMGSPESEAGRSKDETQHRVTLKMGVWMGKTEVTQRQWVTVIGTTPSTFKGADLPVESVSWEDCQDFFKKLNEKLADGRYRLPTEAEWEYACRAGTTGPYAGELDEVGWYCDNSGNTTHPVGQKRANAWGLCDMHGNVWEWCQDRYGDYSVGNVIDPTGAVSGSYRVLRGGSWSSGVYKCRSTYRNYNSPGSRGNVPGFRAVLPLGQQ